MPKKTSADYQAEQKKAESLLMGVVDLSEPATPAPQRISVAALKSSGQLRNFREISPGVLRYMGNSLQAKLRVRSKEGLYELWDMSQDRPAFVTKSENMNDIDKVLRQNFGASLVSDRVELEGLKTAGTDVPKVGDAVDTKMGRGRVVEITEDDGNVLFRVEYPHTTETHLLKDIFQVVPPGLGFSEQSETASKLQAAGDFGDPAQLSEGDRVRVIAPGRLQGQMGQVKGFHPGSEDFVGGQLVVVQMDDGQETFKISADQLERAASKRQAQGEFQVGDQVRAKRDIDVPKPGSGVNPNDPFLVSPTGTAYTIPAGTIGEINYVSAGSFHVMWQGFDKAINMQGSELEKI